jgi:sterol 3beta-glucosyltransferase
LKTVNDKDVFTMKHAAEQPTIYGFSSAVFPKPSDWGEHMYVTGYFFLEQKSTWEPSQALVNFLEAGSAPIYIGFGSLNFMNNAQTVQLILEAVKRTGQRAVLSTSWSGIQEVDVPEDVCVIDSAPHQWLFPRVKAVVHHGGVATTAVGLRAGRPTTIVPIGLDNPFWARQMHRIGAGPKPIAAKNLTVDALEQSIQEMLNNSIIQERAHAIGEQIRNEDGVANAATIIHQIFAR